LANCPFSELAYQIIVVERRGRVAELAGALGVSAPVVYSRLNGRTRFRPDEVRRLIEALDDQRLLRFFADNSRYVVARRPIGEEVEAITDATAKTLHEAIDLMQIVTGALEDGLKLDDRDRRAILKEVKDAETAIANLRVAVEARITARAR
jgi:hypothetical protein